MAYRRRLSVGVVVALLSALVPVAVVAFVAWRVSVQNLQERLDTIAALLLKREEQITEQASGILRHLTATHLPPCSHEHIRFMRQLTVNTPALDEIAYTDETGRIGCSSWGEGRYDFESGTEVGRTRDGATLISLSYMSPFSGGSLALALAHGPYLALISLGHLVDVIVEPNMQLGLATRDGTPVVTIGTDSDGALLRALAGGGTVAVPGYRQAVARSPEWVAVAVYPAGGFLPYLYTDYDSLLPSLLMAGGFVFLLTLSIWMKRPSPLAELRSAIRRKELMVHYQPMVDQHTGLCVGAEALLRWRRSNSSWIQPDLFIPIAEGSRLVEPMTDLLLGIVAEELGPLLKANPALHVSLNLYAEDVRTGRVLDVLEETLIAAGVRPRQIWLEVTERSFMDIESARTMLAQAHQRGYIVAIDDFGSGYSSLQYLQSLPVDVLKVDKSFVGPIGRGAVSSHVIYHIIEMAKSLNLVVVAEGVETQGQADYLAGLGVTLVQGWLYAKAMPARELRQYVGRRHARTEQPVRQASLPLSL